jgi:hypothetical protein
MAKKQTFAKLKCKSCGLELYPGDKDRHTSSTGHKEFIEVKEK